MKENNLRNIAIYLGGIGLIILILTIFWIITDVHYFQLFTRIDSKIASELGGFISGFVGVFWSAAGVILIYSNFREQRIFNDKQQFESSFFNMISTYHSLVNSTKGYVHKNSSSVVEEFSGRSFFSAVLNEIKNGLESEEFLNAMLQIRDLPEVAELIKINSEKKFSEGVEPIVNTGALSIKIKAHGATKEFIVSQYEYYYKKHQEKLGHYYRFIYNIIKFTIEEREKYKDAKRYINLIQAQMSNDELSLIFYNALSIYGETGNGEKRFYQWLNEFDFFENIDYHSLIDRSHHEYYKTKFKFLTNIEKSTKLACSN